VTVARRAESGGGACVRAASGIGSIRASNVDPIAAHLKGVCSFGMTDLVAPGADAPSLALREYQ
jgi:hypothetical protein